MKNKNVILMILVLGAGSFFSGCGKEGKQLVKVGQKTITQEDLQELGEMNRRLKPFLATEEGTKRLLDDYVEQTLLYQEGVHRGLHRSGEIKKRVEAYEKALISQAALDDEINKRANDFYSGNSQKFETVTISHILISTSKRDEKKAQEIVGKVKERLTKEDFAKVASDLSDDSETRKSEGRLGPVFSDDRRMQGRGWGDLVTRAFSLTEGQVAGPIKTKDGFHFVKVVEGKKLIPFEQAEPAIRSQIQADVRTAFVKELEGKYRIQYAEAARALRPSAQPAMPAAMPVASPAVDVKVPAPGESK